MFSESHFFSEFGIRNIQTSFLKYSTVASGARVLLMVFCGMVRPESSRISSPKLNVFETKELQCNFTHDF